MISVAIVDVNREVRLGLQNLLNSVEGFSCIVTFGDGVTALEHIINYGPDVLLTDIDTPSMSGGKFITSIKQIMPEIEIIILSNHTDDESIFNALKSGANGYLSRDVFPTRLLAAIKEVVNGGAPMNKAVARRVVSSFSNAGTNKLPKISKREGDVLELLCKGYNYNAIAEALYISPNTVRYHLKNIYKKLNVKTRYEAVLKVREMKIFG